MKKNTKIGLLIIFFLVFQLSNNNFNVHSASFPIISNIHHTPINPTPQDNVTVMAYVSHPEGLKNVELRYLIEGSGDWKTSNMVNYFDDTFYGHIPPQVLDAKIIYNLVATSIDDYIQTSMNYSYTVYENNAPTISNIIRDPILPSFDEIVNITANVYDITGIYSVFLKYSFNDGVPTFVPMNYDDNNSIYLASIPNSVINTSVKYWIEATNNNLQSSTSSIFHYISLGDIPYLYEIWTNPLNATENLPLTFYVSLFSRCIIVEGKIYYKIDQGDVNELWLNQTDDIQWASESIEGNLLSGGSVIEYWCQFNYSHDGQYHLYPNSPVHHFKSVVEYNPPEIESIAIYPSIIVKGDNVVINTTVSDQSIVDVECIWTIPGLLNDSINSMTNIQGTNIWTTSITTSDLPENKNVVVTIRATDTNGEKAILYSGFFINDGSPPVLYGIKDLRNQTLCHTSEHTLYVYVNDTSEIDYVLIHLWIANGTQYYSNYTMIKGGGQIFYYTIDNSHFDISVSTWITYRFEARDIHGYSIQSDDFTFYVGDLTGPAFKDFSSPEIIGYENNPIFKVKLDDENGSGIQSVSLVFSDDGWITNSCLTLDYDDNNWWKAILPELNLLITREYYFSAIDWYNNPSQSYISNYTSEDIYQPKCVSWKLNDGNPINDTVSTIHIEVWLEDPNGFKTSNVNFTFNSLKENQNFNYTLEHVSANYFHSYINYNWIAHDFISYRFETEDLIGNIGQSNIYSFTVSDTLEPNIDPNIAYSGGAWKNDQSDDEDPNNIYADAWLLDFQQSFVITTTVEDDTLTEVRLYYGTSESSFSSYVVMNDVGSNQFEGIISSSILTTIYTSSSTPAFTYELLFLKIWAEDNASHVEEFYFWDDDNICFELYDFTSPILSNFIIPSTSDTGTYPLFKVDAEDYKAIADAHIRFRYSDTTTSWYDMTLESGDYFDGTWKYNSWQVPTNFDGIVFVDFEFTDRDGKFYITYWQCTDTDKQTTTNSDYNFTARDATAPTILDHYVSPNEPEYNEQFRFYVEVTDSLTGLDNVWIEWWKDDVKQNNLSLSLYLEDIFRSDLLGTYEYNTKIQYIAHAIDNRGNEAYTSQFTFYIEDTVDPIISNVYHTPNPITETNNYITVYATVTDAGAGVDYVTVKWYKNGYYQYNQQMNYIGNNQWSYDIYVGNWDVGDELEFKIYAYDQADPTNSKITGLYGPYTITDTTPPSISSISRSPSTVEEFDSVTIRATVIDSGSGVDYVRLYYKRLSIWQYTTMTVVSGKYQGSFMAGSVGHLDRYYVKAWDNEGNYAQSSTYSYTVQSGGWWQPAIDSELEDIDINTKFDEGFLHLRKEQFNFYPTHLTKYVIVEYGEVGNPSKHSVVALSNNSHYSAYVASAISLYLSYKISIFLKTGQVIYSEEKIIVLKDLTLPSIEVSYKPDYPQFGDKILFRIDVQDASGIKEVKCLFSSDGEWQEGFIQRTNKGYIHTHILTKSIRFKFEVLDNNDFCNSSGILEFLVFLDLEETNKVNESSLSNLLVICGGTLVVFSIWRTFQKRNSSFKIRRKDYVK